MNDGWRIGLVLLAGLAFGIALNLTTNRQEPVTEVESIPGLLWPSPPTIGPFALNRLEHEEFTVNDLRGHWSFLFFGFTNCPDICPTTLQQLSETIEALAGDDVDPPQVVFVSVDPGRDTAEHVDQYVRYFNGDFIGLSGNDEQIRSFTTMLGIVAVKGKADDSGAYQVDHSASVLVVDPQARLVGVLSSPHNADSMATRYKQIRQVVTRG